MEHLVAIVIGGAVFAVFLTMAVIGHLDRVPDDRTPEERHMDDIW